MLLVMGSCTNFIPWFFFLFTCQNKPGNSTKKDVFLLLRIKILFFAFCEDFVFIGWEPTTWSADNCLQIMVCSCVIPSKSVFATNNILLMRNSNQAIVVVALSLWEGNQLISASFHQKIRNKLGYRMIKQLLNSVIVKYRDCQCPADRLFASALTSANDLSRGKFLKKLWCCVGGKYNEIIGFYQLGW